MFIYIGTKRWPTTLFMPNYALRAKTVSKSGR